ncbi:MAG: bifunctional glutamate N-acetyltransferase/amino-acid acetyltransferase ArgJ [Bacillota bacterium]|nr:bifunctional glutamate N-acetyltransferase/amino-acid acetyltransferase ArgJ [Bacillota bacterium]
MKTANKSIPGGVTAPRGFRVAAGSAGLKRDPSLPDLALLVSEAPAAAAAVFTRNRVQAAPLLVCREHLAGGRRVRAVVVNAGNANACTGGQGLADARETAAAVAQGLGVAAEEVLVASTGVIGVPLPMAKLRAGLAGLPAKLEQSVGADEAAARAIMTTDTFPKFGAVEVELNGVPVRVGGMAKGSGMIHPDLATMLAFLTTDADLPPAALDAAFREVVDRTFNAVTVDGDTSTNDFAVLLANGQAKNPPVTPGSPAYAAFVAALEEVAGKLARDIARDGEGATKLLTIEVVHAPSDGAARTIAKTVATSCLVKTAMFGEDPNWGRILAAAGRAPADFDPAKADVYLAGRLVARGGVAQPFDEAGLKAELGRREIAVRLDLNQGDGAATVWSCDLSYDYVRINGRYRT